MSDSSSVQLFYSKEESWGVINKGSPLAAPQLTELRFTNESLNQTTETAKSAEIRNDRAVADIVRVGVSANGEVGIELSYGAYDDFYAGLLYDDWTTDVGVVAEAVTVTEDSPNSTSTISSAGSPGVFGNIVAGQFVQIYNSTASPNNDGFYRVVSADVNQFVVNGTLNAGADTISVKGARIKNGVTRQSMTLEKWFSDINEFVNFAGMRIGTGSLDITPGSIITGQFAFEGKIAAAAGATIGDGSPVAATTADVMNAVDNVTDILIDGAPLGTDDGCFTSINFQVNASTRPQPCIGQLANSGIGIGQNTIEGTIEAYFTNRTLYEKYIDFVTTGLSFRTVDGAGNSYLWDFPTFKFVSGEVNAGGNDQDVLVSLSFEAKRDPVTGNMIQICRFAA